MIIGAEEYQYLHLRAPQVKAEEIKIEARRDFDEVQVTLPCGERRSFNRKELKEITERLVAALNWLCEEGRQREF